MTDPTTQLFLVLLAAFISILSFTILINRRGLLPLRSDNSFDSKAPMRRLEESLVSISSHKDAGIRYTAYSILHFPEDNWFFSKLEALKNPPLLFDVAHELREFIGAEDTSVCVLGTSGIAVGVATGLVAKRPLFFFNRRGFPNPDRLSPGLGPLALPSISPGSETVLVDSHARTRFASATSFDLLTDQLGVTPTKLLVPLSFDMTFKRRTDRPMEYCSLCHFPERAGEIASLLSGITKEKLTELVSDPSGKFWQYPPFEYKRKPYAVFDSPGLVRRPGWFIGRGTDLSVINQIAPELAKYSRRIDPSDEGIWQFFSDPSLVEDFARAVGANLNLSNYDQLIGIGHLGTAFSIAIAYYNQDSFRGSIVSHLGMHGFVPKLDSLANKRILAVQMRFQTGVYAVDVFHRVQELGGTLTDMLTVFHPQEAKSWFRRNYQTSIGHLSRLGVSISSLAQPTPHI